MASTFSTDLKLELMATGENAGTWGTKTNTNLNLVQQAIAGYETINVASSDVTLAMSNASISNARNMVLEFTGTLAANRTVTIPDNIEKFYTIIDSTTHSNFTLTFKTASQSGVLLCQGNKYILYSDGTNVFIALEQKTWRAVTAAETVQAGAQLLIDTSSSALSMTLPASPSVGDEVSFMDSKYTFDTNNLTVLRNSQKIVNNSSDLTVGVEGAAFTLVYANSTVGWTYKEK